MRIYFIDYENVREGGLKGIEELSATDVVYIFYSDNANMLSFDMHQRINGAKAAVKFTKVEAGTKNSLDFQLVTFLGYVTAKDENAELYIVSQDKGFENVCKFWRGSNRKIRTVFDLTGVNADEKKEKIVAEMKKIDAPDANIKAVCEMVTTLKTKQGINNAIVKKFGNKQASEYYKVIKPLIKDKK